MTGRLAICILAVAGVSSLAGQGVHPTAAFTLDVERERFFSGTPTPMNVQFDEWVRRCRIVTGGALIPNTQAPSQGAGQTRPVNSGKLLVLCSRSKASRHKPR